MKIRLFLDGLVLMVIGASTLVRGAFKLATLFGTDKLLSRMGASQQGSKNAWRRRRCDRIGVRWTKIRIVISLMLIC